MHLSNSVLWNNSQNENTSHIDEKKQIIKGVVFWIISKSLSQTHKNYCSKRYKNKHFSKGTDSFINWLKKDILNWSTWKLFERILIEEILLQNFWTLTSLEHDDNWIDLIVKSWNIKIWTDTTMNSIPEKISIKEKTLKLRNLEIDIYNKNLTNLFEWSVSQQPDLCWLLEFRGIEQYKKIIINCFNNWLKNWFENNWYDYLSGNKNIKKLISDVVFIIKNVLNNTIKTWKLEGFNWTYNDYSYETNYSQENKAFSLTIKNNETIICVYKIFLTEKYLEKIQRIKVFHNQNSVNLMTKKSKKLRMKIWFRDKTNFQDLKLERSQEDTEIEDKLQWDKTHWHIIDKLRRKIIFQQVSQILKRKKEYDEKY